MESAGEKAERLDVGKWIRMNRTDSSTTGAVTAPSPDESHAHDGRGGLASRSFIGLLITQMLGAMNDNIFRWFVVPIGKDLVGEEYKTLAVSAGLALLVLPFVLLVSPAAYLSDRFSKRWVIVWCKVAEIVVMILGVAAVLSGSLTAMFAVLFLMGAQSALFGPAKYGGIPEIVRPDRIPAANGLIGMTTIVAIVAGSVLGGYLYTWTTPLGQQNWWASILVLVGVAGVGTLTSLLIQPLPAADPGRRFSLNVAAETVRDVSTLVSRRPLLLAAVGSAFFWSVAGLFTLNVDYFATDDLGVAQRFVGPLLAAVALGVGLGNVMAGLLSRGRIELGIVPVGAAGIAVSAVLLFGSPDTDMVNMRVAIIDDEKAVPESSLSDGALPAPAVHTNKVRLESPKHLIVHEGNRQATYQLALGVKPQADVHVDLGCDAQVTVEPSTLAFTPDDWDRPQTITVTAVNDPLIEGLHTGTITHHFRSRDPVFQGIGDLWNSGYLLSAACLLLLGVAAGMYDVPLQSFLQYNSPENARGSIMAAVNFLTFVGTLVASGIYPLLTQTLGLTGRTIFLLGGLGMIPVVLVVYRLKTYATLRFFFGSLLRLRYRVRIHGLENLPETGGALVVSNHVSWMDGALLLVAAPRRIRFIALAQFVTPWWIRGLSRVAGVIPIVTGKRSVVQAIRQGREAIRQGELVGIFPEGGITRSGSLQGFRPGFLAVLRETGAPVVPLYIDGMWGSIFSYSGGRFFRKWPRGFRRTFDLWIGQPIEHPGSVAKVREAVSLLGCAAVEDRIRRQPTLPRQFVRMCRANLRRTKVSDTLGMTMTGGDMLIRSLILRRVVRRGILAADERYVGLLLPPTSAGVLANAVVAIDRRVAVNLNYTLSNDILNQCLQQCGIRHVLTSRKMIDRLGVTLAAEAVYVEDLKDRVTRADKLLAAAATWLLPAWVLERLLGLHRIAPDDLLTVVFTSGSTGRPKGVMLSQLNVGSNMASFNDLLHLSQRDVMVGILPFFHSFGFTVTLWTGLTLEPKVVYHANPLEPVQVGRLSRQHGANILISTPTFLRTYVRKCEPEDFARMDVIITGAERLPRDLADAFEARFGCRPVEGYGTTELAPVVSTNIPAKRMRAEIFTGRKEGTVGQPMPGISAKIVDLDTGEDLEPGKSGMLLVTGPNVMQGYWDLPQQTAEVIRGRWYVTGDVAEMDSEGFIRITGRVSRFSKLAGEMVPHMRVEEAITAALKIDQDDLRLVVTSVSDVRKGERLIVLHTGLGIPPEEICRRLRAAGLPPLWIPSPDSFWQIDEIPVLGSGKLDLKRVRDAAEELARGASGVGR